MEYLWTDPRPDLTLDSNRWHRLFRLISQMEDKGKAEKLHKILWSIRQHGTELLPHRLGLKLDPVIGNHWEDQDEFEEMKRKHLAPFANEIVELFRRLES